MRYLSLFSGIEAATQAWQPLGWECVAVSEIEPFPCAVLDHHYPHVPNLGDVTKITEQQIKDLGQIDLIVFGSPCQNLSVAGNRKGLAGTQSGLFYDSIRIIQYAREHCGARFALWENVPGAFSSNRGADFAAVVEQMAGLSDVDVPTNGWGKEGAAVGANGLLEWSVLDAQWFGLAQRRKRVFAIVDFGDWASRPPILLEREGLRGDSAPSREAMQDVATDATRSFNESGFAGYSGDKVAGTLRQAGGACGHGSECLTVRAFDKQRIGQYADNNVASTCAARDYKDATDLVVCHGTQDPITNTETAYAMGCNSGQENVIAFSEPSRARALDVFTDAEPVPTLTARMGTGGNNMTMVCQNAIAIAGNIIGRTDGNGGNQLGLDESGAYYTLTTNDRHAVAYGCLNPSQPQSKRVYGVDGVSPALQTGTKSGDITPSIYIPPSVVRRLTPIECERLQGFPQNFTKIPYRNKSADDCPNGVRYKALGNSMAVNVMAWIGKRIEQAVTICY